MANGRGDQVPLVTASHLTAPEQRTPAGGAFSGGSADSQGLAEGGQTILKAGSGGSRWAEDQ